MTASTPLEVRENPFQGYRGPARQALEAFGIGVWSEVDLVNDRGSSFKGVILPRSETFDDLHIVIKLFNGYNVGIAADRIRTAVELGYKKAVYRIPEKAFPVDSRKKNVTLLGTGGTIASRLDYRTGAVIPAFTPGELYGAVPELADIANMDTKKLFGVFSENMGPEQYKALALAIGAPAQAQFGLGSLLGGGGEGPAVNLEEHLALTEGRALLVDLAQEVPLHLGADLSVDEAIQSAHPLMREGDVCLRHGQHAHLERGRRRAALAATGHQEDQPTRGQESCRAGPLERKGTDRGSGHNLSMLPPHHETVSDQFWALPQATSYCVCQVFAGSTWLPVGRGNSIHAG